MNRLSGSSCGDVQIKTLPQALADDESWAVLEEDVHLPLARVLDLDFDKGGISHRPELGCGS